MDEIIDNLCKLSFTKLEAKIYVTLIKEGELSGYQLAKINISRSSVYAALEHMYEIGIVLSKIDGAQVYSAQNPVTLFGRLRREFVQISKSVEDELKGFYDQNFEEKFSNLKGFETVISNAKEVLKSAKKEICMNTDLDIQIFKDEIIELRKRGVRCILFSFADLNCNGLDIESYIDKDDKCSDTEPTRIMLVADCNLTLVADTYKSRGTWLGTLTNNTLFTSIVTEHILHDIYNLITKKKSGKEIEQKFKLNTMIETR